MVHNFVKKHTQLGQQKGQTIIDLKKLNQLSKSLLNDEPISNVDDMANLFHIGTSPGGAQPKVLININTKNGDIYRGDNLPSNDQESWILKFNKDIGLESDQYRGKIEYAYYLMAKKSKINVVESKLMEIEDEKKENELVLESISKLEDTRKCWRLINGVLMEKTKLEVVPEMRTVI